MSQFRLDDETLKFGGPHIRPDAVTDKTPPGFRPLRLTILPGGMVVELSRPQATVGRGSACDVRLPLADVSRQHCRLVFENGRWWVKECGSLNGLYVNDECVHERPLATGDRVRVGGATLLIQPAELRTSDFERIVIRSIAVALSPAPDQIRRAS